MSSRPELKLDWCSRAAAKYAVEHWHYSKSLPVPPCNYLGCWESDGFIGVLVFSRGTARHGAAEYGLKHTEFVELTRIAFRKHFAPVSRVLSIAFNLVKRLNPGLRLIVSFADPNQGHLGVIYQASNCCFVGQKQPTVEYVGPDGKQWHSRMVSPTGSKKVFGRYRPVWKPDQCAKVKLLGKFKYLMPLDPAMRRQIEPLRKPYPKRVRSVDSDTSANHAEEGGATPTRTL